MLWFLVTLKRVPFLFLFLNSVMYYTKLTKSEFHLKEWISPLTPALIPLEILALTTSISRITKSTLVTTENWLKALIWDNLSVLPSDHPWQTRKTLIKNILSKTISDLRKSKTCFCFYLKDNYIVFPNTTLI